MGEIPGYGTYIIGEVEGARLMLVGDPARKAVQDLGDEDQKKVGIVLSLTEALALQRKIDEILGVVQKQDLSPVSAKSREKTFPLVDTMGNE